MYYVEPVIPQAVLLLMLINSGDVLLLMWL